MVCDEGPVEHAEPSTGPNQEGTLEAEFRSRAYDVFVSATKGFDPERGTPYRSGSGFVPVMPSGTLKKSGPPAWRARANRPNL